jgi:hypothetical protein
MEIVYCEVQIEYLNICYIKFKGKLLTVQCRGFTVVKINYMNNRYFVILHVKCWAEWQDKQTYF